MGNLIFQIFLIYCCIKLAMSVNYVDLSYPINNETIFHPRHRRYERLIDYHGYTPEGIWFATYSMKTSEHTATHMDTPYHSYESGINLEQIPTDNLISVPAVMIDVSHKVSELDGIHYNYAISKIDFMEWESTNGLIPQRALVLINTGWGARWPNEDYLGEDRFGKLSFPAHDGSPSPWLEKYLYFGERGQSPFTPTKGLQGLGHALETGKSNNWSSDSTNGSYTLG